MTNENGNGNNTVKSGNGSVKSKKPKDTEKKKPNSENEKLDLSGSFLDDPDFDKLANFEMLRKSFESKLLLVQTEFRTKVDEMREGYGGKIEMMKEMMDKKDQLISNLSIKVGKLEADVEHLKKSQNFVTNETTEIKQKMDNTFSNNIKKLDELESKTQDLEDRSRRDNLVFFGIPECDEVTTENAEEVLISILKKQNFLAQTFNPETTAYFERVHRIGPRRKDAARPRPIIAKMTFYKDKEEILKNSSKFKNSPYNVAEHYSKATLSISRLLNKAKEAKLNCQQVSSFKINHRRLVMRYQNPVTQQSYSRGFNLCDIVDNANWYIPSTRGTNSNRHGGYQSR